MFGERAKKRAVGTVAIGAVLSVLAVAGPASGRLIVTEVMYDPASNESRWEWLELHNAGDAAVDLDGWWVDRVGDRARAEPIANITARALVGAETVDNATVIPAGGVAVLYDGDGLGFEPDRFRAAWPGMAPGTVLIGVAGWTANQLANEPTPYANAAPGLPAMTIGLWDGEASYLQDVADFGTPTRPSRRVWRVDHAAAAAGYDDDPPWRDTLGTASLLYLDPFADPMDPNNSGRSNPPWGGAWESTATFQRAPAGGGDFGSPGVPPGGSPTAGGLIVTEVMYDPASSTGATNEWEWIEVYNAGPTVDFAATPHWLDDDDGDRLEGPNLTVGEIPSGETAILFNGSAFTADEMRTAWDRPGEPPLRLFYVADWPSLNNTGDVVGLWDNSLAYAWDHHDGETVGRAVAGVVYDDSAPWPSGVEGDAIRLLSLSADPADPSGWETARGDFADPHGYESAVVLRDTAVLDNSGADRGSPGFVWPDIVSPLPGDYNRDGVVDAADYTVWRDGGPLPTETVTLGVTDAADYLVWRAGFGASTDSSSAGAAPEPAGAVLVVIGWASMRGKRKGRPAR